jgi:AmpD protein
MHSKAVPAIMIEPYAIDAEGWCRGVDRQPSPNCDARPAGGPIDLLLIHNISLPPGEFGGPYIADLFGNRLAYDAHPYFDHLRPLRVSAHFLVRRDGSVLQFVAIGQRAWHAGVSSYAGRERCNDFSIGIELEGCDDRPFEAAQYANLVLLTRALLVRYPHLDITGHSNVAPGRKTDPGPHFDWPHYRGALAAGPRNWPSD